MRNAVLLHPLEGAAVGDLPKEVEAEVILTGLQGPL